MRAPRTCGGRQLVHPAMPVESSSAARRPHFIDLPVRTPRMHSTKGERLIAMRQQSSCFVPSHAILLAAPPKRAPPEVTNVVAECRNRGSTRSTRPQYSGVVWLDPLFSSAIASDRPEPAPAPLHLLSRAPARLLRAQRHAPRGSRALACRAEERDRVGADAPAATLLGGSAYAVVSYF
jgi:hypothetical protein